MKNEPQTGIGFGMLRVDVDNPQHREALVSSLVRGVELFDLGDVSATDFEAKLELLIGLAGDIRIPRLTLIIRGALGAATRLTERPKNDHGIALEWVYLVADPEFALPRFEWDHLAFYSALSAELDLLESHAASGMISSYGVGSAGLTYAKEDSEALSLEPMVRSEDGTPSPQRTFFKWIEFPFNLFESEAATETNQLVGSETKTLLQAAHAWGIRTIARRPFDAMTDGGLRRLVAYPDHHRLDLNLAVKNTLEAALAAEVEYLAKPNHAKTEAGADPASLSPLWAHRLRDQLKHVSDPEQWKEIVRRKIEPDLSDLRAVAKWKAKSETPAEGTVRVRYFDTLDALMLAVRLWCEKAAAERNERVRSEIVQAVPVLALTRRPEDRDLAVLAMRIYRSVPGLDFVLAGLRSPKYVQTLARVPGELPSEEVLSGDAIQSALIAAHASLQEKIPS